jgi:hypothetical protein
MAPTAACEALKVCRLLLHATAGSKTHGLAFRHLKMYAAKNMAPCTVWQPRLALTWKQMIGEWQGCVQQVPRLASRRSCGTKPRLSQLTTNTTDNT